MAIVDINTGRIIGAKKNTLTWYHEEGHIQYNISDRGSYNNFLEQKSFEVCVGVIVLFLSLTSFFPTSPLRYILLIIMILSLLLFCMLQMYEEVWCWNYAYIKKKEQEK